MYYTLEVKNPDSRLNPEDWLTDLIIGIIDYFFKTSTIEIKPGDRLGMSLRNSVTGTEPVCISLRRADQLSAEIVLDQIIRIFDSNKDFFLNGYLTVQFDHVQLPHGSGGSIAKRNVGESSADFIKKKACFLKYAIPPYHKDQYCLPYVLVLGRAHLQYKHGEISKKECERYQRSFKILRGAAVNLCLEAGVDMTAITLGCSFDEVRKFQAVLHNYQIVIYRGSGTQR